MSRNVKSRHKHHDGRYYDTCPWRCGLNPDDKVKGNRTTG